MIEGWGGRGGGVVKRCLLEWRFVRESGGDDEKMGIFGSPIINESSDPCHSAEAPTKMASRMARAITPIAQSNTVMSGHIESKEGFLKSV